MAFYDLLIALIKVQTIQHFPKFVLYFVFALMCDRVNGEWMAFDKSLQQLRNVALCNVLVSIVLMKYPACELGGKYTLTHQWIHSNW